MAATTSWAGSCFGAGKPNTPADRVGAGAAAAMFHARRHEQAIERRDRVFSTHFRGHRFVILDRGGRRDRSVVPAMVLDQLASGRPELREIERLGVKRR